MQATSLGVAVAISDLEPQPEPEPGPTLIGAMASAPMVVALDNPSGLDVTTGAAPGVVVSATATLTLALPKVGMSAAPQVGELFLADISVPPSVTTRFGESAPDFSAGPILALDSAR